ncbi:flagellar assembly protein FliH [Candidatus Haliotispira prima]|uniref:Flagellar assembly protein FliH n=1 Tax=Candidatus Haliotispira prima TaxID=3034016 RepID=A0ABY8MG25_9SPIO|nr:flagellar assembly protein FliH [Candidatus Haliotispira prima]
MNKRDKIFHPTDVIDLTRQSQREINIVVPKFDDIEEPEEVYTGPTPYEIRSEIANLKEEWASRQREEEDELRNQLEIQRHNLNEELQNMRESAKSSSEQITSGAEQQAKDIIARAEEQAREMIENAKLKVEMVEEEGRERGTREGTKEGYEQGFAEVRRLTNQLHYMISGVLRSREEIIASLESDLIDLTLLIARKVVKVLSENQKDIVIYNTLEALKKLRYRGSVTLRVNPEDMDVSLENKEHFIRVVESLEGIHIVEDHTVQRGGCMVESDFGEIDARVSSQLREVEDKILSVRPVRRRGPRRLSEDIIRKDEEELQNFVNSISSEKLSEGPSGSPSAPSSDRVSSSSEGSQAPSDSSDAISP